LFNLSSSNRRVFVTPYIVLSNSIKLAKYCAILIPDNNLNKTDISTINYLEEKEIPEIFKEKT